MRSRRRCAWRPARRRGDRADADLPNILARSGLRCAAVKPVAMRFGNDGWRLDLDELFRRGGPRTRAIFLNSPANPTGWTATREELRICLLSPATGALDHRRRVYHRSTTMRRRSPSSTTSPSRTTPSLRQTFSKNWAMTGWRIGWISAPPQLGQVIETSSKLRPRGVVGFLQRAQPLALDHGDEFIATQVSASPQPRDRLQRACRDRPCPFQRTGGAFYVFRRRRNREHREARPKLVDEAISGLPPATPSAKPAAASFASVSCASPRADRRGDAPAGGLASPQVGRPTSGAGADDAGLAIGPQARTEHRGWRRSVGTAGDPCRHFRRRG